MAVGGRRAIPTDVWSRAIARIRRDRARSAQVLGRATLQAIAAEASRWKRRDRSALGRAALRVADDLAAAQPAMAIFGRWASEWHEFAPTVATTSIQAWLRRTTRGLAVEERRLCQVARRRLPRGARILTISSSRTVARALLALVPRRRPAEVLCLESRPGGEGRRLASYLRRGGICARVVPDDRRHAALLEVDLVLIGADAVEPNGTVVHKVGTRALAEAARRAQRPLFVLAGHSKFAAARRRGALGVRFDRTPRSLITGLWTDRGSPPKSSRPHAR